MARFFVNESAIIGDIITITGPDVKHISRVLRLEAGDGISVSTGNGVEFNAEITEISSKAVLCKIVAKNTKSTEPPLRVTLYQGLPKGEKMELIIQKSTELGVFQIIPVICERTVVKLDHKKASERKVRWQRIAGEAAKQSRRMQVPQVTEPVKFETALEQIPSDTLVLMPWEEQKSGGIRQVLKAREGNTGDIAIFIGPEGGFSRNEALMAETRGVHLVSLGPRIMRTETAGIVATAIVLYELGDLGGLDNG